MKNKKFWIIIYFIALIVIGSLGYYIIGGSNWTLLDSLYMTIITLASVGYGEVHALDNSGKVWSILLIIFGVTGVGALFRTINEEFIQSQLFWKNKMKKTISKLENHYIICGYGRMGAVIAKELKAKNQKFLIIENNEKKVEIIREGGMICLQGDATSEDTLFTGSQESKYVEIQYFQAPSQSNISRCHISRSPGMKIILISDISRLQENKHKPVVTQIWGHTGIQTKNTTHETKTKNKTTAT